MHVTFLTSLVIFSFLREYMSAADDLVSLKEDMFRIA